VIIAGFLRRHINLNGQMERLNLNGMARGMWLVVDWCWILQRNYHFSSLETAFYWVSLLRDL
jgi:hypothetical protein